MRNDAPTYGLRPFALFMPSTHEIKNMRPMPWPSIAIAAAALASYCLLEVGNGPPLNFIYFQF